MPIIKSAKKQMRKTAKNTSRNNKFRDMYREIRVGYERMIKSGDKAGAKKELPKLYSIIDRLDKKNIIHKNNAARKKSRFNRMLKDLASKKKA